MRYFEVLVQQQNKVQLLYGDSILRRVDDSAQAPSYESGKSRCSELRDADVSSRSELTSDTTTS